jgi:hypothetical protein
MFVTKLSRHEDRDRRRTRGQTGENTDGNRAADPAPVVGLFRDWRFGWLDVSGLMAAAGEILDTR